MNTKAAWLVISLVIAVLAVNEVEVAMAVSCNPMQLAPCASAITSAARPTDLCCSRIKAQRPCLCQYMKDPNLQKFINSPGAKKVATYCHSPFPKC